MSRLSLIPAAAVLLFTACDQPPLKEIASAESALTSARANGADAYAPERWSEAQRELAEAQRKLAAKDYRGALSAASGATEKARLASQAADAARVNIESAVQILQEEVRAKLDEVEASRQEAIDARLPASVFADIDAQVQTARGALEAISASLQKKDFLAARSSAETLKASVLPLPERLRDARLLWETEHPARRRRSGARR
jgi:hypothetical protein